MKPSGIATMFGPMFLSMVGVINILSTIGVSTFALDLPVSDQVKQDLVNANGRVHARALPLPIPSLNLGVLDSETVGPGPEPALASSVPNVADSPLPDVDGNDPLASSSFGGDMTWYDTGLGSCGWWNNANDHICAISQVLYNRTNVDGNANHNSVCGRRIHLQRGDRGIDVVVADNCPGCSEFSIDVTRSVFEALGNLDEGRVQIQWQWI